MGREWSVRDDPSSPKGEREQRKIEAIHREETQAW